MYFLVFICTGTCVYLCIGVSLYVEIKEQFEGYL